MFTLTPLTFFNVNTNRRSVNWSGRQRRHIKSRNLKKLLKGGRRAASTADSVCLYTVQGKKRTRDRLSVFISSLTTVFH